VGKLNVKKKGVTLAKVLVKWKHQLPLLESSRMN